MERVVTSLNKREEKDLLLEMYEIGNLPNDLKLISKELSEFHGLLRRIKDRLSVGKIVSSLNEDYVTDIIKLCDIAFALGNNVDKEELKKFMYADWSEFSYDDIKRHIKKVFEIINGLKVSKFLSEKPNCFWIKRESCKTEKEVFVICATPDMKYEPIITFYRKGKTVLNTEAIFLILENEGDKEQYNSLIKELDNEQYFIEIVYKEDLQRIFKSNNKYSEFSKILKRDLYS